MNYADAPNDAMKLPTNPKFLIYWGKVKKRILIIACIAASVALALPPVHPALPPVEYADTEATTNVSFAAWQKHVGKFKFSLACRTTATNNVQFAFGRDADDDGIVSLEESDLVVGWDCGKWFVQGGYDAERIETSVGTDDGQTLAWTVRLSPRTAVPVSVTATVDGTPVFGGVDAGMFYRKNWNMFRLTGRGLADSAESSEVQILPDSLTILMR